jgi:hypothetical protein
MAMRPSATSIKSKDCDRAENVIWSSLPTRTASNSCRDLSRDLNDLAAQGMLILYSVERVKWSIDKLDVQSILMATDY